MLEMTSPEGEDERSEVLAVAAEVEAQWARLKDSWIDSLEKGYKHAGPVIQLLEAAQNRPELRQLFPYTSHDLVCFSRCTTYRFTTDCPYAVGRLDGNFEIRQDWVDEKGWGQKVIGSGDLETAIELLVGNLPEGVGPAVRGPASRFVKPEGWVL